MTAKRMQGKSRSLGDRDDDQKRKRQEKEADNLKVCPYEKNGSVAQFMRRSRFVGFGSDEADLHPASLERGVAAQ